MLKSLLSPLTCADCRICCVFDDEDIWETPVITEETKKIVSSALPETEFIPFKNSSLMKMRFYEADELYHCPMLSETGCILGAEKPFDCRIWPFRVMRLGERVTLTISPICPGMIKTPLADLMDFVNGGFADEVFAEAERNPDIVKDYIEGYPILAVK